MKHSHYYYYEILSLWHQLLSVNKGDDSIMVKGEMLLYDFLEWCFWWVFMTKSVIALSQSGYSQV